MKNNETNAVVLNEIDQRLQLFNLEEQNSLEIKQGFEEFLLEIDSFSTKALELVVTSEEEVDKIEEARKARLALMRIRTGADKKRKELKEYPNRYNKAIQDVYNLIENKIKPGEDHLLAQEKFVENLKKERLERLQQERVSEVSKYIEDAHERNLSEMDEDVWESFLDTKKRAYEARIEEEKRAEEERIAEAKKQEEEEIEKERKYKLHIERKDKALPYFKFWSEFEKQLNFAEVSESDFNNFLHRIKKEFIEDERKQEAIRIENDLLKKESAEKEAKAEEERKAREAKEAKIKAEQDAKIKAERDARLKLEKELEDKKAKELSDQKAEEERQQAILNQGDAEKMLDLIDSLESLKTKHTFKSEKNKKIMSDVQTLIDKVIAHIQK